MNWNYHSSTPVFNQDTIPDGIKNAHQVGKGYYGILNVLVGKVKFVWEDTKQEIIVDCSKPFYIETERKHHLEIIEPVTLRVDFYTI